MEKFQSSYAPKIVQWLLEAGELVPVDDDDILAAFNTFDKLVIGEETEENKQRLEAMWRKLLHSGALQSVSWAWGQGAAASRRRIMPMMMLLVRRVRRKTPRVVLGGLMR